MDFVIYFWTIFFIILLITIFPGWMTLLFIVCSIGGGILATYLQQKFNEWFL